MQPDRALTPELQKMPHSWWTACTIICSLEVELSVVCTAVAAKMTCTQSADKEQESVKAGACNRPSVR